MQHLRRHDKTQQQQLLAVKKEAQETLAHLRALLARPSRQKLRVGEMVQIAAAGGLLDNTRSKVG